MAKVFIEETTLTAIGDAIRGKDGTSDLIPVTEMSSRISAIPSGGGGADNSEFIKGLLDGTLTEVKESDIPSSVTTIHKGAFEHQQSLRTVELPDQITTIKDYAFNNCNALARVKMPRNINLIEGLVFSGENSPITELTFYENVPTITTQFIADRWLSKDWFSVYVPGKSLDAYKSAPVWSTSLIAPKLKPNSPYVPPIQDVLMQVNFGKGFYIYLQEFGDNIEASITTSDNTKLTGTVDVQSEGMVWIELNPIGITDSVIATFHATDVDSGEVWTRDFNVKVVEEIVNGTYTVEIPDGVTYGFELNDDGYYESTNKGVDNSFAYCVVHIDNPSGQSIYIDCINYAESNYDFGVISKPDVELFKDHTLSMDGEKILKSFKGLASPDVQTVSLGTQQDGFITIKFIKDSSTGKDNDSLQFKLRFE